MHLQQWLTQKKVTYSNWQGVINKMSIRTTDNVRQIYIKDPDGYWIEINDASKKL